MKRVIVPIDFSETSDKIVRTALQFCLHFNVELYLLHVFDYTHLDLDFNQQKVKTEIDFKKKEMGKLVTSIRNDKKYEKIKIVEAFGHGTLVRNLKSLGFQSKKDLIVLGISGEHRLLRRMFGTKWTEIVQEIENPMFLQPNQLEVDFIKSVVLGINESTTLNKPTSNLLESVLSMYNLEVIKLVHVIADFKDDRVDNVVKKYDLPYTYTEFCDTNISEGLQHFVQRTKDTLLVLKKRTPKLPLQKNIIQELTLDAKIPLMIV